MSLTERSEADEIEALLEWAKDEFPSYRQETESLSETWEYMTEDARSDLNLQHLDDHEIREHLIEAYENGVFD